MTSEFTGLIPENRNVVLARLNEQIALPASAGNEVPEKLWDEPPAWWKIEDQSRTNTCASNAMTSVGELIWFQATGELLQFSRLHNYEHAGVYCGIRSDSGRTLSSVLKASQVDGFALESLMPFTVPVTKEIPPAANTDGKKRVVTHTMDVRSGYDAVRTIIGQNMGGVLNATYWPMTYSGGYLVNRYQPTGRGGHARAWLFLSSRLDNRNRPWIWCANSHSTMAQFNGYELWSPTAIDEALKNDPWGCMGVTAMSNPQPVEVDWTGAMNPFAR